MDGLKNYLQVVLLQAQLIVRVHITESLMETQQSQVISSHRGYLHPKNNSRVKVLTNASLELFLSFQN